jgi:hypothetical protein
MRTVRSTCPVIVAFSLAFGLISLSSGCSNSAADQTSARISPEMEKKTQAMLKTYGQENHAKYRAEYSKRKR